MWTSLAVLCLPLLVVLQFLEACLGVLDVLLVLTLALFEGREVRVELLTLLAQLLYQ